MSMEEQEMMEVRSGTIDGGAGEGVQPAHVESRTTDLTYSERRSWARSIDEMEESKVNQARTIRCFWIGGIISVLFLLIIPVSSTTVSAQPLPDEPSGIQESTGPSSPSRLLEKAQKEGSVRVIVGLRTDFTPEGRLSGAQVDDQRGAIESAGAGLRAELSGAGYQTVREYETVPYIALKLTPEALRAVQDSPRTTTLQEDVDVPVDLADSAPIVQAPTMWANSLTGGGKTIAVLDTGVDRFHPFLGGRVVEEACYSDGSNCPNGQKTQTGTGSGAPCTYANDCRHGTHVAGIAAGQGNFASGVAPNANIMSVQVFSKRTGTRCTDANAGEDPCTLTTTSDVIKGMERVYQLRNTHNFAAVDMSLGAGRHTSHCDSDSSKAIIDNLRAAGIATVASAGNEGFTDAVNAPACVSSAIAVANTTKQDAVAANSNMDRTVDLLAPGSGITSSVPGGAFASLSGTSMAAPHVAGAFALLEEKDPSKNVGDNLFDLQAKGTRITDTRPGGVATKSRINIADAGQVRPPGDSFGSPQSLPNSDAIFNVNGINGAATRESGEPDHRSLSESLGENSVWYSWTAPVSGQVTMDTCISSFDTMLAVYKGSAIGSLSQVASDDDACSDVFNNSGSKLSFDAVAGTTYRIAVADTGAENSQNTFTLKIIDRMQPSVTGTTPANDATGVLQGANVRAPFS
jgi:subtilisin